LAGLDVALGAGAAGTEESGFAVDGAGLAEAAGVAGVAEAVEGEDGDMGTNSASPKTEVSCAAF
jgi:hypothetical protein